MKRALNVSEPPIESPTAVNKLPPSSIPQKKTVSNQVETNKTDVLNDELIKTQTAAPDKKNEGYVPSAPQKIPPVTAKEADQSKEGTPVSDQEPQMKSGSFQNTSDLTPHSGPKQNKVSSDSQKESFDKSGLSGPKTASDGSKTTDSITGKMFGFGSSIFSSASTLISSAVQEESRMTPPSSRKMSAPVQVSPKMAAAPKVSPKGSPIASPNKVPPKGLTSLSQDTKKHEESNESKQDKVSPQPTKSAIVSQPKLHQESCPLCHLKLNIGSKEPPNYSNCSECKTNVCDKCGFNPLPIGKVILFYVNYACI